MNIDKVDFSILKVIEDYGGPLWKNRIHELLLERADELPGIDSISVQTVGRRVDDLHDDGYLQSCITSPKGIKRDLIIAFKLTDTGTEQIQETRRSLFQDLVQQRLFTNGSEQLSKATLIELLADELELDETTKEQFQSEFEHPDLFALSTMYYIKEWIGQELSDDVEKFNKIAQEDAKLQEAIGNPIFDQVKAP